MISDFADENGQNGVLREQTSLSRNLTLNHQTDFLYHATQPFSEITGMARFITSRG